MNVENSLTHLFTINKDADKYYDVLYESYSQRIWYLPGHPGEEVALILQYNSSTVQMTYYKELLVNDDNDIYVNSYHFSTQSQLYFFEVDTSESVDFLIFDKV